jgi:membrane-bound serine protease (ClpP class)
MKLIFFILLSFSFLHAQENYVATRIIELTIDASINPSTLEYIKQAQDKYCHQKELFLIKINTPGGLVSTTKEIITTIGKSSCPFAVWVYPDGASASSAGAIIGAGAHFLFMSQSSNIGAATPITSSGDIAESDSRNKAINDLSALVRSLAKDHNRNVSGFEKMIQKADSFDAKEALSQKIIDGIISSKEELTTFLQNKTFRIGDKHYSLQINSPDTLSVEMSAGNKLLNFLANPSLAYILFLLSLALFYFEFQAPGGFIAGSVGGIFLLISGISFQVLPINIGSIFLIILAFILFFLELFIVSYGLLSIAGIVSLVAGSLFLFNTSDSFLFIERSIIYSITGTFIFLLSFFAYYFYRESKKKKEKFFDFLYQETRITNVLGRNEYQVKIQGETWKASSAQTLQVGDLVSIVSVHQNELKVSVQLVS